MKLLNHSTVYFAAVLFLLLSVWSLVFYFEMLDEIYDSMDDGLENKKMLVIEQAEIDSAILQQVNFEDGYYTVRETSFEQVRDFRDSYRDTLMYMENEEDFEPVRLLESAFEQDGRYYKVKVITSMVEEDDLVKDLLISIIWLYLGLITSILILNNLVLKKVWNPFYRLLSRLKNFSIEKDRQIITEPTDIEEFILLNKSIERLLDKSIKSYIDQKHFIENASHELQTPLAISINKLELLIENTKLNQNQLNILGSVLSNLERLTRFNKSLLLLSKIENRQYIDERKIDFNTLSRELISDFLDFARHKGLSINVTESGDLRFTMNRDLAVILLSNLIKNALVHGKKGTDVKIEISSKSFEIRNSAENFPLEEEYIFTRFQKSGNKRKSTGLGLAIAKAISQKYQLKLEYHFEIQHSFRIEFPKS